MVQAGRLDVVRAAILVLGCILHFSGHGRASAGTDDAAAEHFESKVRSLLIERCGECHGETGKAKGGLRLTSRDALLKGGESGPAVVPGKADESAIVQAVRYTEDPKMPPSGKLSDAEIAELEREIEHETGW